MKLAVVSRVGISTLGVAALIIYPSITRGNTPTTTTVSVKGTDAIYLAGRSDVTIAPAGAPPSGYLFLREPSPGPAVETFPNQMQAVPAEKFTFSATGLVNYNTTNDMTSFGADGAYRPSTFNALAGISGYNGPIGALVGVFLTDTDPQNGTAPATLDFASTGKTSFTSLSPALGQVFFIGDGLTGTGSGTAQTFVAPAGTTRLFLGVVDAPNFLGAPGAYDDNAGAFNVTVAGSGVPEPSSLGILATGGLALLRRRRRKF